MNTPRRAVRLILRSFPGWETLRSAIAAAAGIAVAEVQTRAEGPDAAVWLDARAQLAQYQLVAMIEIDDSRVPAQPDELLPERLSEILREDVVVDDLFATGPSVRSLFRAGGGRGEVRVGRGADGAITVEEIVQATPARPVRDERAGGVIERYAAQGERVANRVYFSRATARQVIAAATVARLAVARVLVHAGAADARELFVPQPVPRALWAELVFRSNGEAIAAIEQAEADVRVAVDLLSQAGYFASRTLRPFEERSDEEIAWQLSSLDSSLAQAAAAECPPDAGALAELDRMREELRRRAR